MTIRAKSKRRRTPAPPALIIESISDARLVGRAFRQKWHLAAEQRKSLIKQLRAIALAADSPQGLAFAAIDALVAAAESAPGATR